MHDYCLLCTLIPEVVALSRLQIDTDLLLILYNKSADELSGGTNIDYRKLRVFSEFFLRF